EGPCSLLHGVSQYLDKRRTAALGSVVPECSIGGVAIPIALSKMLNGSSLGTNHWVLHTPLAFSCVAVNSRLPPRPLRFFIGSLPSKLQRSTFHRCAVLHAVTQGKEATLTSYLLVILNGIHFRPDCPWDSRRQCFVLIFNWFTSGTIISGASTAFSLALCAKDHWEFGTYMGIGLRIASLAALIGPPVSGVLFDNYGLLQYLAASWFSLVGALSFQARRLLLRV
ncbi:monocarboxylate permease-like protein, partial [Penicillium riverlandense]|uniref:monocarboxylate permease-like protein n=1 Tax=Penicillium riverlandense TaxID=1903569 RepID=UPI0025476EA5